MCVCVCVCVEVNKDSMEKSWQINRRKEILYKRKIHNIMFFYTHFLFSCYFIEHPSHFNIFH